MNSIFFIDEQHSINFKKVLLRWNVGKTNMEYQTACYILAVPMIFEKVEKYIGSFKSPIDWIWFWEFKYTLSKLRHSPSKLFEKTGAKYEVKSV